MTIISPHPESTMLSFPHRTLAGIVSAILATLLSAAPAHAQMWETLWQFDGQAISDVLGYSVSGAGDVDGDGFDDLIVGALLADPGGLTEAGSAFVYSGATGSLIWQFDGQVSLDKLGFSVSGAGDVDGDGFDDLIVGAPVADPGGLSNAGSAYVYSGATGNLIWQFDGQASGDFLGHSVSGAGDVDGDGFDDLIVGASSADPGGLTDAGSAYVYSGATGSLIWQFDGQAWVDQLGISVSGIGDVDGDGFDDVIVSAPSADPGGVSSAGSAYVYSGAT
ncbi:MAG: FG-GAP-like repeat-containing protein, partial [Planctomycetota bacterium]|nr:FG-GAP-like repeat-containing protein [Planctomycetota bacterium]